MPRYLYAAVLLAAVVTSAHAQKLTLPTEVKGSPGDFVTIKAETQGKIVRWYAPDPGLSLFPSELLRDTKVAVVVGRVAGRYRLVAYTAEGDAPSAPAETVIILGDVPPGPIPPGPGPTPPGPTPPTPPAPVDPLVQKLQAAYAAETDAGKAALLPKLAAVYRHGSEVSQTNAVATWDGLFGAMTRKAAEQGVAGRLLGLQKVLRDDVLNTFPTERTKPMDFAGRELAKTTLARAAALLESVKP